MNTGIRNIIRDKTVIYVKLRDIHAPAIQKNKKWIFDRTPAPYLSTVPDKTGPYRTGPDKFTFFSQIYRTGQNLSGYGKFTVTGQIYRTFGPDKFCPVFCISKDKNHEYTLVQ